MKVDPRMLTEFFSDESLGSPENAVGFLLWKLVHRFQRDIDRDLESVDLTHLQFTTLAMVGWLNRSRNPTTQAELSRYADIQAMQISQILTVLERKGMVERTASPKNPRAKCVNITRDGLAALRRAMPIAIKVQQQLFGRTGAPGGELLGLLQTISGKATGAPKRARKSRRSG